MYDNYKKLTLEFGHKELSDMITSYALTTGFLDDSRYFVRVNKVNFDTDNKSIVTECDIFKYMEN